MKDRFIGSPEEFAADLAARAEVVAQGQVAAEIARAKRFNHRPGKLGAVIGWALHQLERPNSATDPAPPEYVESQIDDLINQAP